MTAEIRSRRRAAGVAQVTHRVVHRFEVVESEQDGQDPSQVRSPGPGVDSLAEQGAIRQAGDRSWFAW
jgi:hypothetical protein